MRLPKTESHSIRCSVSIVTNRRSTASSIRSRIEYPVKLAGFAPLIAPQELE